MKKLKSVGFYTECLNSGAEFAFREDGAVFVRTKGWSDRFRTFVTSKWQRDSYWENDPDLKDLPSRAKFGFNTFTFVPTTRLRLPQET